MKLLDIAVAIFMAPVCALLSLALKCRRHVKIPGASLALSVFAALAVILVAPVFLLSLLE